MKALQSPLARAILRDAYTTSKHIPLHNGALFTYADREYMICVVPKAGRECKGNWWDKLKGMFK